MLLALAVSHSELPLGRLADLSASTKGLSERLVGLNQAHENVPLNGWVLLSTCNRVELYIDAVRFHDGLDVVTDALEACTGWTRPELTTTFQVRSGSPAAEHLFAVACGLESIVLGEAEITGQVRIAFNDALHHQTSTALLNDLFQQALRTAKKVATTTTLGRAGRSSAEVVLDTAGARLGLQTLSDSRVLVIGTGAYSRVICAELALRRAGEVGVWSPSGRRGASVDKYGFSHVTPTRLQGWFNAADIVIACSGQGTPLVRPEHFERREPGKELVVMDMSLVPDVDAGVAQLDDVTVLGLNSLASGISSVGEQALAEARAVVAAGVERFESRQRVRRADPMIIRMRGYVSDLIDEEVDALRGRLADDTVDEIERAMRRVYKKVMHGPTVSAQKHAEAGTADDYLRALHTVMGIDMQNSEAVALIDAEALPLGEVNPDNYLQLDAESEHQQVEGVR